ncbi:MAG: hypothetical protein KJZ87_13925 [Thermoguttaceae bacterium]|nr:hypothetical protein [Thermoguttaceae bacterium]
MKQFACALLFAISLLLGCGGEPESPDLNNAQTQSEIEQHDANVDAAESSQAQP